MVLFSFTRGETLCLPAVTFAPWVVSKSIFLQMIDTLRQCVVLSYDAHETKIRYPFFLGE